MSILIKGMEMPYNCGHCFLRRGECKERIYMPNRPSNCPLVPVPTPHGRLIDADALLEDVRQSASEQDAENLNDWWVGEMPTIIPAEEGET